MIDKSQLLSLQLNSTPKQTIKSMSATVKNAGSKDDINSSAMKAAKEFESSFLTTMLEQMWTGVSAEAPFGGGHAEKAYRSMVVGEYAKSISAAGGIGIADHVYREILSMQEGQS